jgi:hypothetical protein
VERKRRLTNAGWLALRTRPNNNARSAALDKSKRKEENVRAEKWEIGPRDWMNDSIRFYGPWCNGANALLTIYLYDATETEQFARWLLAKLNGKPPYRRAVTKIAPKQR